jgi:hypothetical protein
MKKVVTMGEADRVILSGVAIYELTSKCLLLEVCVTSINGIH